MRYINRQAEYRNAITAANESDDQDPPWDNEAQYDPPPILAHITQKAIDIYLERTQSDGTISNISWWQCANGYTAIALHDLWSGPSGNIKNYDTLTSLLHQCERSNGSFINDWNDDSLWWALCCMHMYSSEHDVWFLNRAMEVWRHVRKYVCHKGEQFFNGMDMEGAVFWKSKPPDEDHVNAVSTALFAELSPSAEEYVDHARRSLGWILRCRYIPRQGLVLDHIELASQKAVDWKFTYNTGITLGTCALLYEATGEEEYMLLACHMAQQAMKRKLWVEDNGVLTERGAYGYGTHDPLENNDAVGFKAVLIRHLGVLYDVVLRTRCELIRAKRTAVVIKAFVNVNFRSQQERNSGGWGRYGPWWNGPFRPRWVSSHSQMAVLDVMAATMLVNRRPDRGSGGGMAYPGTTP